MSIERTGTDIRGTLLLSGSTLFVGGAVTGTINDTQVVLGVLVDGEKQATFEGRLDGTTISGEWQCPAIKDQGVWFGDLRGAQGDS